MNKELKYPWFFGLITSILLLAGCSPAFRWPILASDAEIVMQSQTFDPFELVLIQADGSGAQLLEGPENFIKPVWSSDRKRIYGLSNPKGMPPLDDIGFPAYWNLEDGSLTRCDSDLPYFVQIEEYKNLDNPNEVILFNKEEIVLFDLSTCKEERILVDYTKRAGDVGISGFSYNPERQELLYGEHPVSYDSRADYRLVKLDLRTGERVELAKGINPAWSPDGTQIAYISEDGLFILQSADEQQPRQIINAQFFDLKKSASPWYDAPIPRWSPDSEWLVFHLCIEEICSVDETPVYKIRVSDGELVKIFTGGKFPQWRP